MTGRVTYADTSAFLGEISRRKLQRVAESSDTLRRCVLIHNIMRSTASILHHAELSPPPSPTTSSHPQQQEERPDYYDDEEPSMEEEEELAYREASYGHQGPSATEHGASAASASFASHFAFNVSPSSYRPPSSAGEQDWLNSILDDLQEADVQVSVVDADDEEMTDASAAVAAPPTAPECEQQPSTCWHPPLFPPPHCNVVSSSSPPSSPPLRPISPRCIPIPDAFFEDDCTSCAADDDSPPTSPPGLEADTMDSDEDDEDEFHYGMMDSSDFSEASTPSSSTEFPQTVGADLVLFSNLPFNRLRPVLCHTTY